MMIANNILILLLMIIDCIASITFAFQISYLLPSHCRQSHLASTTSYTTSTHHHCNKLSPKLLLDGIDEIITSQSQSLSISPTDILNHINIQHEQDVAYAKSSSLPFENYNISMRSNSSYRSLIEYETIPSNNNEQRPIAIQTNQPILSIDEIKLLTKACEEYWNRNRNEEEMQSSSKSRFTYQRKGNSEAHLSDVVQYHASHQHQQGLDTNDLQSSSSVEHLVNDLLLNRIYPWVRTAYLSNEGDISVDELELYVYDSLFIRYNATEAKIDSQLDNEGSRESRESAESGQERSVGAGQPLHRDLGYVSVNIMLNSQDEFEGGGTFFENQLLPMMMSNDHSSDNQYEAEVVQPLKPRGVGHAIAHYSSNRHAGAATLKGVRDILVMFLAAATPNKHSTAQPSSSSIPSTDNNRIQPPKWELNARIKSAARTYCTSHCSNNIEEQVICHILHHKLAIDQVEDDGEAWHYLGMALLDYYNHQVESSSNEAKNIEGTLELAISCLNMASEYTPCDGRLYNNLGIALERQQSSMREDLHSEIVSAYERSLLIHSKCESVGCDVGADYESACLNYGLYLSKLDLFDEAVDVLSRIAGEKAKHQPVVNEGDEMDAAGWARQRVLQDAQGLLSFCKRQV